MRLSRRAKQVWLSSRSCGFPCHFAKVSGATSLLPCVKRGIYLPFLSGLTYQWKWYVNDLYVARIFVLFHATPYLLLYGPNLTLLYPSRNLPVYATLPCLLLTPLRLSSASAQAGSGLLSSKDVNGNCCVSNWGRVMAVFCKRARR